MKASGLWSWLVGRRTIGVAALVCLLLVAGGTQAQAVSPTNVSLPGLSGLESEPNGTTALATPINPAGARMRGNILAADTDLYSFSASAGDRVYAATMTSASAASGDTVLELIAPDGTTVLESDDENGTFGGSSSSIAGAQIAVSGTHYLRVTGFFTTTQVRPYDLYLKKRSGPLTLETEPNDATPEALLAPPYMSGSTSAAADVDEFGFPANAADTLFLSEDLDPERDSTQWNGRVGAGIFGGFILVTADNGTEAGPDSEAFFTTAQNSGSPFADVRSSDATFGTYNLSATVIPAQTQSCRVYSSAAPVAIADLATTTSTITVPDNFTVARLALDLDLTHTAMTNLDISLQTPAGNEIVPLTDVGGASSQMDLRLDDAAALPALFTLVADMMVAPEGAGGKLEWTDGEPAAGTWSLVIRDDTAADTGTLNSWSLIACEDPNPPPAGTPTTVVSTDFESGDGGFTHSGTADEWERGLPSFAPITTCAGGTKCWKTDLDNTYDASSSQELVSPPISLAGITDPIELSWAQRYQMESASFDHFWVEVRQVGGATPRKVFEWDGPTMTQPVGNPAVTIQQSAGWATMKADISSFAGQNVEVVYHLDSDTTVQLGGVAIDDVKVTRFASPRQLDLTTQGSGSGFVDSAPAGIDCGHNPAGTHTDCTESYADGTSVTLTAHPAAAGSSFAGFSGGGCSGSGTTCTVTMDAAKSITATFTASGSGGGAPETTITKAPKSKLKLKGHKKKAKAKFEFSSNAAGSTFQCSLDGKAAAPCSSPQTYKVKKGKHTFSVFAVDPGGTADPSPATAKFKVKKPKRH